jgi:hypothetical protein
MSKFEFLIAAVLFMALAILMQGSAHAMGEKPKADNAVQKQAKDTKRCLNHPLKIKVGETVFTLPRDIQGLYVQNGKVGDPEADGEKLFKKYYKEHPDSCGDAPPIEVTNFAFLPGKALATQPSFGSSQVGVYLAQERPFDMYEKAKKSLQNEAVKVTDLPVEDGFYVWRRKTPDTIFHEFEIYIAQDKDLVSPTGEPAVFVCGKNMNYGCSTSIQRGDVNIGVKMFNPSKGIFGPFYKSLLAYTNQMLGKDEQSTLQK